MRTFKKCFPIVLLMLAMSMIVVTTGCNPINSDVDLKTPVTSTPTNGGVTIQSEAGNMTDSFKVIKGRAVEFTIVSDTSFKRFRLYGEYDLNTSSYQELTTRTFSYTYNTLGVRTVRGRGIRADGSWRDTTAPVVVRDSLITNPVDTFNTVPLKIAQGSILPTGQYKYHMYFGASRSKYFGHLNNTQNEYNPGYVISRAGINPPWEGQLFVNGTPVNGYWEADFITYDTLVLIEYCRYMVPGGAPGAWYYANTSSSQYSHNGQMWVRFKGGKAYIYNQTSNPMPWSNGDRYLGYKPSSDGTVDTLYMSMREMTFSNPESFNPYLLYWQNDLRNSGGINTPQRNVVVMPGVGYMKVWFNESELNGRYIKARWGQDDQLAPGLFLTDAHYVDPDDGDVVRLRF